MLEAGEVGVLFQVKDAATATLQRIADEFNKIQNLVDQITAAVDKIGGSEGGLLKLQEALGLVGKAGEDSANLISESFGKVDSAVKTAADGANALKQSFLEAAKAAETIHNAAANMVPQGGAGGSAGHTNPAMGGAAAGAGGATGGGHPLAPMIGGAHGGRAGLAHHLANFVGGEFGVAYEGAHLAEEWFHEAGSVAQAENNLRLAGVSDEGVKKAGAAAGGFAQYGLSQLEALNAIRSVMGPLNTQGGTDTGVEDAIALLPTMAKFSQLARVMKGEGGGDASAQMYELIKGGELRNKLTPEEMGKFIEDYAQVYEGTGGKVDPKTFYQGLKYSKSAGGFFSDEFVKNYLPAIEAEEGGSTAGTMLMTQASAFLGGRFKKPALADLHQMGIYDSNNNLKDQESLVTNPFEWMQNTFIPALKAAGFTTQEQQIGKVEELMNRNAAEAAALLGIRPGNVERTASAIGRSDTLSDATQKIGDNDPLAAMAKVEAGMANLAAAFGGPFIGQITGGLNNLAAALDWVSKLEKPHLGADGKPEMLNDPHQDAHIGKDGKPEMLDQAKPWSPMNWLWPSEGHAGELPHGMPSPPADTKPYDPLSSIHAPGPAPSAAAPNVTISAAISAPLSGDAHVTVGSVVANFPGFGQLVGQITSAVLGQIKGQMSGVLSGASTHPAGFDGRAHPIPVDGGTMHGGH